MDSFHSAVTGIASQGMTSTIGMAGSAEEEQF